MTSRYCLAVAAACAALAVAQAATASPRPIGRIIVPSIRLNVTFFNGQTAADTDRGPSHYPWTAMPGEDRTVAIAGHRVTHTHPFFNLGELKRHALIKIRYGAGFVHTACYRVSGSAVVSPSDVSVTNDVGHERLVLTTCTPPHSAAYRLVVDANRAPC